MDRLGVYYHTPARTDRSGIVTAGYFGCFVDSLAPHVGELVLFLHSGAATDPALDYRIQASNVRVVFLGKKKHAAARALLGKTLVTPLAEELKRLDMLMVRAPTPLFAALYSLCDASEVQCVPLLVGDYAEGNKHLPFHFPKRQAVATLNSYIDRQQKRLLIHRPVLVNSRKLAAKYEGIASAVYETRTTTLSERSFYVREDTCLTPENRLLYTGRFEWAKGLQTLFDAVYELIVVRESAVHLDLAGWQDCSGPSIQQVLQSQAEKRGIGERIHWHGKKSIGPELDALYRSADVYILPSYAEGFPRTIWEAMANSLPVIATRVGSIPDFLSDGEDVLLVDPRSVHQLADAIVELQKVPKLRRKLIANGRALASSQTLEKQAERLSVILNGILDVA